MFEIKESEIIKIVLFITAFFILFAVVLVLIMLAYGRRKQRHLLEVQHMKFEFSQTLLTSQMEIQEQTLRNISQELHDNISQKLGLVKLQLNQLQQAQPTIDLGETKGVITETIADIRALSKSLHPDRIASIPLKESMEHEIALLKNATQVTINCHIDENLEFLTPDQRIILFRIFQELLNNALKYAEATIITISLTPSENGIILQVQDNGIGLPPNYQKGIGHLSIENRIKMLGGAFELLSDPQSGTVGKIKFPL